MARTLLAILWTSVVGPLLLLSFTVFDPSLQRGLYFPMAALTALVISLCFAVAKRDQLMGFAQFLVVSLTAGITTLMVLSLVMHVLFQTIPHIVWVLSPFGFNVVQFVISNFVATLAYSFACGTVFWYVAIHRNRAYVSPYPVFVANHMNALRRAKPVIDVSRAPKAYEDSSRRAA